MFAHGEARWEKQNLGARVRHSLRIQLRAISVTFFRKVSSLRTHTGPHRYAWEPVYPTGGLPHGSCLRGSIGLFCQYVHLAGHKAELGI